MQKVRAAQGRIYPFQVDTPLIGNHVKFMAIHSSSIMPIQKLGMEEKNIDTTVLA